MKRVAGFILMLILAAAARGQQFTSAFESPLYSGSSTGVALAGQDNWFEPVGGSAPYRVLTYVPNVYGFQPNPSGQVQFAAGTSNGPTSPARIQHAVNFASNDTWTASWDMAANFLASPPATNSIGSFSLEDSVTQRSFSVLATWPNVTTPTVWRAGFLVYDAAGAPALAPGLFPGPQWQTLQTNHWYRLTATFSLSQNRILEVSITDLHTLASTSAQPVGWFLRGGSVSSLPPPTGIRLTSAGTAVGNIVGWDNIDVCPFQVTGFTPPNGPEGTIVHILGCGFGTDPTDLSVSVRQGSTQGVPFTVVAATDTDITARLGPVPNGAVFGPILVTRGNGAVQILVPTLDDVIPEDPAGTRTWSRGGDPRSAQSLTQFQPNPLPPPPPDVHWFFGQNAAGMMQVVVSVPTTTSRIQPNTTLRVFAKLHETNLRLGADLESTAVRLRVGGDAQYLAEHVRDVIQSAYSANGVNTSCQIAFVDPNQRLLTLRLLDGLGNPVPVNFGIFDVCTVDPILISPFPIGPVTAFYNAGLTNQVGTALVSPVNLTGNDGATISPTVPVTGGLRVETAFIDLATPNSSFTTRAWGVRAGQPNELIGTGRLQRVGTQLQVLSDFTPIGATQVRVEVYFNTALKATALLTAGTMASIAPPPSGMPSVSGCGGRPTIAANAPFVWIDLDRTCMVTLTGGSPVPGNQIRLIAGPGAANVQNFQAFDLAAGLDSQLDVGQFVIFSSVEGGICYANCDGSTTPPELNVLDFSCFLNLFASGDAAANCDGSTTAPELNVLDFSCFLNAFSAGCP